VLLRQGDVVLVLAFKADTMPTTAAGRDVEKLGTDDFFAEDVDVFLVELRERLLHRVGIGLFIFALGLFGLGLFGLRLFDHGLDGLGLFGLGFVCHRFLGLLLVDRALHLHDLTLLLGNRELLLLDFALFLFDRDLLLLDRALLLLDTTLLLVERSLPLLDGAIFDRKRGALGGGGGGGRCDIGQIHVHGTRHGLRDVE